MPLSDYKIGIQNTSLLICQISQIHICIGGVTDGISASRLGHTNVPSNMPSRLAKIKKKLRVIGWHFFVIAIFILSC